MTPSTCSLQQLRIVSVQLNVACKGFAHQQSFVVRRQPGLSHTIGVGEQFLDQQAVIGGEGFEGCFVSSVAPRAVRVGVAKITGNNKFGDGLLLVLISTPPLIISFIVN